MGLFSKFFSRENEIPVDARDANAAQAPADGGADEAQNDAVTEQFDRAAVMQQAVPAAQQAAAVRPTPVAAPVAPANPVAMSTAVALATPVAVPATAVAPATPAAVPPTAATAPQKPAAPPKREVTPAQPTAAVPAKAAAKVGATVVKTEPVAKSASAPATQPAQVAPARKTTPNARPSGEVAAKPKRTPKPTPRMMFAPSTDIAPPRSAGAMPPLAQSAPGRADPRPLEADVDAAVDRLLDATPSRTNGSSASDEAADRHAVIETFAAMAKLHSQPLRELMFQLSFGRTPRQWAGACRPVVLPLLSASKQIGLPEMTGLLGALDAALQRAEGEPSACIGETAARALEQAYARLHEHMPHAFAAAAATDHRRLILLESLLLQVPALHRRTLAKLYAAGLTTLSQLSQARADELAAVAGIDRELARAVVEHVQRFEHERSRFDPIALRSRVQERLRAVIDRLEQLQAEFERADRDESHERKRAARRAREAAVLELDLLFAEVGDLELIEELKRFPVSAKIRRVESYLERLEVSA